MSASTIRSVSLGCVFNPYSNKSLVAPTFFVPTLGVSSSVAAENVSRKSCFLNTSSVPHPLNPLESKRWKLESFGFRAPFGGFGFWEVLHTSGVVFFGSRSPQLEVGCFALGVLTGNFGVRCLGILTWGLAVRLNGSPPTLGVSEIWLFGSPQLGTFGSFGFRVITTLATLVSRLFGRLVLLSPEPLEL